LGTVMLVISLIHTVFFFSIAGAGAGAKSILVGLHSTNLKGAFAFLECKVHRRCSPNKDVGPVFRPLLGPKTETYCVVLADPFGYENAQTVCYVMGGKDESCLSAQQSPAFKLKVWCDYYAALPYDQIDGYRLGFVPDALPKFKIPSKIKACLSHFIGMEAQSKC
jgi:hypothetical protein